MLVAVGKDPATHVVPVENVEEEDAVALVDPVENAEESDQTEDDEEGGESEMEEGTDINGNQRAERKIGS